MTPVTHLPTAVTAPCEACPRPAMWQVGPGTQSCSQCLGFVLASLYVDEPHPYHPFLPVPLKRGKW